MASSPQSSGAARIVAARIPILAVLAVLTSLALVQVPSLGTRFAPEELVAPDEAARLDAAHVRDRFGENGEAVVLLVESDDVLSLPTLGWMHAAARTLAATPGVVQVVSPTTVPVPRRRSTIEDADVGLDALEEEPLEGPDALDPRMAALAEIALAHPGRYPLGVVSIANEGVEVVVEPVVTGETPTAADRDAIAEATQRSPLLRRRIVSDDHRVAVLAAVIASGASEDETAHVLSVARELMDGAPDGVEVALTGLPAIRAEMIGALRADQTLLVSIAALLSLAVLLVGLRSVAGVLLPFGTVGMTVVMTVGAMALFGEPLNLLTNMIPPLLLTIGMAEAVHMVLRWEEEVRRGLDRIAAAIETLRHMWLPCFVTTFTTAIGFGALLFQETAILRRFGLIAGLASMLAYVVTVTFVPAMLPYLSPRKVHAVEAREDDLLERLMVRLAHLVSVEWRWTVVGATLLFLAGSAVARDIEVDSRLMDQFARGSSVARSTAVLETALDGVRSLDVVLEAEPGHFLTPEGIDDLDAVAAHLAAQPGVLRVTSEADWLRELRGTLLGDVTEASPFSTAGEVRALRDLAESEDAPLERYVTESGDAARIEVRLADRGASRILMMLDGVSDVAVTRGLTARFSGEAYDASRGLDRIVRSLGSLGAAVLMIFLVMTLLFRSLRLGLLSIPPNALPLVLTLAYMVLRGIPLHAATVIVFTVTVGLSVDGATHVIARFQEEALPGLGAREVVLRTIRSSGRGVVLSAATLLFGYLSLLFSAFEPVRLFGELSLVAILGALTAQIVLLPALLAGFALPAAATKARA